MRFSTLYLLGLLSVASVAGESTASSQVTEARTNPTCEDEAEGVQTEDGCLHSRTYRSPGPIVQPTLVIALHGDAPFSRPSYQYGFAEEIAALGKNIVAVGLLRPGYTDAKGSISDGVRGQTVGDNFDDDRVSHIADAIEHLGLHHSSSRIVLAGHSGGAAIAGRLIALRPGLVDHAILVSCPCDINTWRAHMYERSGFEGFDGPLPIESPIELAPSVPTTTQVSLFVGRHDETAPPEFSRRYYQALKAAGIDTELEIIDGGHEVFLRKEILSAVVIAVE